MIEASRSETPLRTTFSIKLNGKTVAIATVGQAYQFLTSLNSVEWMEHRSQHDAAIEALKGAADNDKLYGNAMRYAAMRVRSRWEIEQYLARKKCPAPLSATWFGYELGERLLLSDMYFSYGVNGAGCGGRPGFPGRGMGGDTYLGSPPSFKAGSRRMTMVKRASEFIMIADTVADAYGDFRIIPTPRLPGSAVDDGLGTIHRGGCNVLFADGHVQWYLRSDLMVAAPPIPDDAWKQRMWNVDYEPSQPWP